MFRNVTGVQTCALPISAPCRDGVGCLTRFGHDARPRLPQSMQGAAAWQPGLAAPPLEPLAEEVVVVGLAALRRIPDPHQRDAERVSMTQMRSSA